MQELNLSQSAVRRRIKALQKKQKLTDARLVHDPDPSFFEFRQVTELSAYFLGLFISDGHLAKRLGSISITGKADEDNRRLFQYIASQSGAAYHDYSDTERPSVAIKVNRNPIVKRLARMGFSNRKDYTASIPQEFFANCPEMIPHIVRGIFDGDGSVYLVQRQNGNPIIRASFTTCSPSLIRQLLNIFSTAGIKCRTFRSVADMEEALEAYDTFGIEEAKKAGWNVENGIVITKRNLLKLYRYLYPHPGVVALARKKAIFDAHLTFTEDLAKLPYSPHAERELIEYIRGNYSQKDAELLIARRYAIREVHRNPSFTQLTLPLPEEL